MGDSLLEAKESALRSYDRFLNYFNKELEIIEHSGYESGENRLKQLSKRAKEEIFGATKGKKYFSQVEEFSKDIKDRALASRVLFLSRVVDYLKETSKSSKYGPAQGSFWEDIGQTLEKLALEVEKKLN